MILALLASSLTLWVSLSPVAALVTITVYAVTAIAAIVMAAFTYFCWTIRNSPEYIPGAPGGPGCRSLATAPRPDPSLRFID